MRPNMLWQRAFYSWILLENHLTAHWFHSYCSAALLSNYFFFWTTYSDVYVLASITVSIECKFARIFTQHCVTWCISDRSLYIFALLRVTLALFFLIIIYKRLIISYIYCESFKKCWVVHLYVGLHLMYNSYMVIVFILSIVTRQWLCWFCPLRWS